MSSYHIDIFLTIFLFAKEHQKRQIKKNRKKDAQRMEKGAQRIEKGAQRMEKGAQRIEKGAPAFGTPFSTTTVLLYFYGLSVNTDTRPLSSVACAVSSSLVADVSSAAAELF